MALYIFKKTSLANEPRNLLYKYPKIIDEEIPFLIITFNSIINDIIAFFLLNLPYGHKYKCICKEPNNHSCNKECSFFGKFGGFNRECSLKYEYV